MIGYYIHHHGRGHLHRAAAVAAQLTEPVTALSSLPEPAAPHPFAAWLRLPHDDDAAADLAAATAHDGPPRAHTAGGALHWAPLGSAGYRDRMAMLAGWLTTHRPRLLVTDVSVEVTVLARTLGVPVVVMAGAGRRDDAPHTLAYRLAERVVAPWPDAVYRPTYLEPFADKVRYTGAISRFDARPVVAPSGRGQVLVLLGTGGTELTAADVQAASAACPGAAWQAHGVAGSAWSEDVWSALMAADVVVVHAGQNALAEVAAARRPAVVVPQPRPFGEQAATADALAEHGLAVVTEGWPRPRDWPGVIARALALGGERWAEWSPGDGAARAARAVEEVLVDA